MCLKMLYNRFNILVVVLLLNFNAILSASLQDAANFDGRCRATSQSPEKRVIRSSMAIKALVANTYPDDRYPNGYIAELWLLDVYKGADKLAASLGLTLAEDDDTAKLRDRRVNVSRWGDDSRCWNGLVRQKTYIVLLTSSRPGRSYATTQTTTSPATTTRQTKYPSLDARYDDHFGAAIDFSVETERKILKALGWNPWTEWGSCSATCGGGSQTRERTCAQPGSPGTCPTYNVERRSCNTFDCRGAINTLSVSESRYYKPSPSAFKRVEERPSAWQIRPGSYFLLPFKEAFGKEFPQEFTIFLTIRQTEESEGIIFSLNGRDSRQEYISLGLNSGRLELVHSMPNGTNMIDIPAKITDGHWHQLAISVQGGSSVRTYLDCHWITTQILHRHSIAIPPDTDLIVGYMFQGELEQLTVSDALFSVSQQCSPNAVPYRDEQLMSRAAFQLTPQPTKPPQKSKGDIAIVEIIDDSTSHGKVISWKSEHFNPAKDYLEEEYVDLDFKENSPKALPVQSVKKEKINLSENFSEGSGVGEESDEEDSKNEIGSGGMTFELEWSSWSVCNVSCGQGYQFRMSRCQDNGFLEECVSSGMENKETRSCQQVDCNQKPSEIAKTEKPNSKKRRKMSGSIEEDVLEYEFITRNDVDSVRQKSHKKTVSSSSASGVHLIPTHTPKDEIDEQTNSIPHIPNYWIPSKSKNLDHGDTKKQSPSSTPSANSDDKSKSNDKCWCQNGGICPVGSTKCKCRKGFTGKRCERPICRPDCSNKGECVAPDVCSCPEGFTGARCQQAFCYPPCQNGGTCIAPFQCQCPLGVSGALCQEFSCQPKCENGGLCIGHNVCSCPHGFSGPDCRDRTCTVHCENGGVCTMPDNQCKCRQGFYGARCHKKICRRYIAVREPQRRSYKQVVDVDYETVCGPGDGVGNFVNCKKTRPEYKSIVKVVYRTAYKCADEFDNKDSSNRESKSQTATLEESKN